MRKTLLTLLFMVFFTIASAQAQAYFGFPYAGYGFPYNMFGYPYYGSGIGVPYSGIPYYGGIFGTPYVTAPPPDLSGWTWTSPTTATSPPLPDGTSAGVAVDFVAGYEGLSPYYQQNYQQNYDSPFYGNGWDYVWNQPYGWQPYNTYMYQQSYYPYGYQQSYNPFGYQQSYYPYGYQLYGSGLYGGLYGGVGSPWPVVGRWLDMDRWRLYPN